MRLRERDLRAFRRNRDARSLQLGGLRWWLSWPFHHWVLILSLETLLVETILLLGETNGQSTGY